jgi:preprotein translocase subunit SecE
MTITKVKSETKTSQGNKKPSMSKATSNEETPFNLIEYLQGVRQEWHKISWPTRPQIVAETGVVLVVVALFSAFVFGVDKLFQFIIQVIT